MAQGLLSPDDMMMSYQQDNTRLLGMPLDEGSRGMLLPLGRVNGQRTLAVPQFGLDMYRAFTAPARAYRGQITDPTEEAFNLASNLTGQGLIANIPARMAAQRTGQTMLGSAGGVSSVSGGQLRAPQTDELGFYSQALETARMLPQAKGTGEQFRKMLDKAGVKPDEITFTPELEGLLSQPKITRDELVGLLEANRIRPQETVLESSGTGGIDELYFSDTRVVEPEEALGYDYINEEANRILDDDFSMYKDDIKGTLIENGVDQDEALRMVNAFEKGGSSSETLSGNDVNLIGEAAEDIIKKSYYDDTYNQQIRYSDPDSGYTIEGSDDWGYYITDPNGNQVSSGNGVYSFEEARVVATDDAIDRGILGGEGETRFMSSTEDGGTNYREMLLQVPEYQGMTKEFIATGHFDEPNIAVHARTKDRNSETGINDVLYVEELQSDWGQRGRNFGFDRPQDKEKMSKIRSEGEKIEFALDDAIQERQSLTVKAGQEIAKKIGGTYEQMMGDIRFSDGSKAVSQGEIKRFLEGEPVITFTPDGKEKILNPLEDTPEEWRKAQEKVADAQQKFNEIRKEYRGYTAEIPVAPFVMNSKKFAELGIKRLINQAAKEGKRYISFSTGDTQARRWNEAGLRTFYDKIIPDAAKGVVKKLDKDAYVGSDFFVEGLDSNDGKRFTIEITPKMREEALRGQPLFSGGLPVPASGLLGQEENNNRKIPAGLLDA